jgi:replication factor A1
MSRAQLKTANKQFNNLPNDYEITMTNDTMIEPCNSDADDLPRINLDLVPLNQLTNKNPNELVGKCQSRAKITVFFMFVSFTFINFYLYLLKNSILAKRCYGCS